MIFISKLVYQGFSRKASSEKEAERLKLNIKDYLYIKKKVREAVWFLRGEVNDDVFMKIDESLTEYKPQNTEIIETTYNMKDNSKTITALSSVEPKTPEEIIQLLKIDITKWRISQIWNKQKSDKWLISASIVPLPQEKIVEESFIDKLARHDLPMYDKIDPTYLNVASTERICGVVSLQDLHFGKPGNEDLKTVVDDAVLYLVGKAYKNYNLDKLILVIGSDTLNMDTFSGTTTKGTPVDNSEVATKAYLKAFDALCGVIGRSKEFCNELEIVYIPGNHDRLSSFHLVHALSQVFKLTVSITFDVHYAERKVIMFGKNMIALEHGDVTSKNNPLIYATEFSEEWGKSKHRYLYTGHYHGRKTKEVITENEEQGFVTRILPALTSSDYYHYHNKWTGNQRAAIIHIHEYDKGLISEFVYSV